MKNEFYKEVLVPLFGCGKYILGGIENSRVVGLMDQTGIIVSTVRADGFSYYRINDKYAHLELAHTLYSPGKVNGRSTNIPSMYLTLKGLAVVKEVFYLLLSTVDKERVWAFTEAICRLNEQDETVYGLPNIHEDISASSGSSGKERTKEHACLHGKCGGCRQSLQI